MIDKWQSSRNRPAFARLLNSDKLPQYPGFLSSYLGFSKVQHLYYFADFIAPRVIWPLITLDNSRKLEGNTQPAMRADHWLKAFLDNGRTDEVLVWGSILGYPNFGVQNHANHANLFQLDSVLTAIACMYKLIKANPSRFREPTEGLENECVWGIHHEDWQRAHAVITFVKYRRAFFRHCPEGGPGKYWNTRLRKARCYAYATPDVIASVAARQGNVVGNGAG
ncbi:hypothetical protein CI102_3242 [Trichoderma harzianum]|uniref:Uncharacterized protein n=1 Tax=Trichoderma harzianum CBS 226.95 TaxID=983964 RepID=A0A2T4A679_TRIHA|nr:hypothetical protein M431DRAFT_119523 [Trichoderma harzianum CBS 226.95]PKK50361.1 hypothetical protein CI102_3242 [Trichoderma harzianum]PTB52557.1 hypothetical protein M431DRAFT_119523 [Trichoderma harzianum CBS 226.95]